MRRNTWLRKRLERVRVHSNADGTFGIEPVWKEPFGIRADGGLRHRDLPPGLFTRMETAEEIEVVLNRVLGYGARKKRETAGEDAT